VEQLSSDEEQEKLLMATINHKVMNRYPLSLTYRQIFVKQLIQLLEKNNLTISESLAINYSRLITDCDHNNSNCDQNFNYLSYILSDGQIISLRESNYLVINGTTGLKSWTAAKHLAHWVSNNKQLVENKSILELGSGIGLTGIVILKTCSPNSFTFSDHNSMVFEILEHNLLINNVNQKSNIYAIDWEDSNCLDHYLIDNNPDVIIAADVVFDPLITSYLCTVLNKLLNEKNRNRVCYIGCTQRNNETIEHFRKLIVDKYNLKFEDICSSDNNNDLSSFYYDSLNTKSYILKISLQT
jgi:predicted nicotinamide N-methyase